MTQTNSERIQDAVVDAVNQLHYDTYDAITNSALAGYHVWGMAYPDGVHVFPQELFHTWLVFTTKGGKKYISSYNIHYNGKNHTYVGWKGWARTINKLTHRTHTVKRSEIAYSSTATQIHPVNDWDTSTS